MSRQKFVQDPVHGGLKLDSVFLRLIESTELQRLHSVHQLGLAYLVYPGANHSRFEHSLGTFYVAGRMCSSLRLDPGESDLVRCAALLHDIGHLPYSHTFEVVLQEQFGINHEEISR
ncbi:MAG: HD domain-containing protein, partial [Thermoplasmata archaeon]|nr:HD domain-containing protein [Thermoplasmata archaeon]